MLDVKVRKKLNQSHNFAKPNITTTTIYLENSIIFDYHHHCRTISFLCEEGRLTISLSFSFSLSTKPLWRIRKFIFILTISLCLHCYYFRFAFLWLITWKTILRKEHSCFILTAIILITFSYTPSYPIQPSTHSRIQSSISFSMCFRSTDMNLFDDYFSFSFSKEKIFFYFFLLLWI